MFRSPRAGRLLALFSFAVLSAAAAEPELKFLYPVAAGCGSSSTAVVGQVDPWPPQVWTDSPGIIFTPTPITGTFNVEIAPDAAPGPHLVRLYNEEGASAPHVFIVAPGKELRDREPNDSFKSPQLLSGLPAVVSGRLDKAGDVDSFAVTLRKGQTVVAWLEAGVLASTFDGLLRLVDSTGTELAFNHDGATVDPLLAWRAPRDGTFVVQVMGFAYPANSEVRLTGGEGCIYRLHLTTGPCLRHTLPLCAERGQKSALQLVGWNLATERAEFDGTQIAPSFALPGIESPYALPLSDLPEALEHEPNNAADQAQPFAIPGAITGRIDPAGDEDRFSFAAQKDHAYELKILGARAGSPIDAWLKIENAERKEVARNDDAAATRDPQLKWTAPADGTFHAVVGELTHRGGADYVYRLAITEARPGVAGAAGAHALKVQAGKDVEIKVTVKRLNGFKGALQLVAVGLPDGISAPEVPVPEKDGEVTLKLTASADAKPAHQPFRLFLKCADAGIKQAVRYVMTSSSENNGVPEGFTDLLIDSTDQLFLTVLPAPPPPPPAPPSPPPPAS